MLATIDNKQQIYDKSIKILDHEAILATSNRIIGLEVTLSPANKFLDFPSELIDKGYLLG